MSKRVKTCPDCGTQMPMNAIRCNRCGYREPAPAAEREGSLPRPIRPENRPVETSRWPEERDHDLPAEEERRTPRNLIPMIAVAAMVLAIIVIAIVLVVQMNKPIQPPPSESESVSSEVFIDGDGNMITGTQPPAGTIIVPEFTPAPTEPPAATEAPAPEATTAPEAEPSATPAPTETPDDSEFDVEDKDDTVYITGSGVNLREGPGTDYDVIIRFDRGTEVKRTGISDDWSRVRYQGNEGFVSNTYVSTEKPDPIVSDAGGKVTLTEDANLREGPGTEHDVYKSLDKGTELERTGKSDNGWTRVKYDGKNLYVHNSLVQDKVETTEKSGTIVLKDEANLRKGPGTGYDVITTKDKGTELERTGETSDGWIRVKYDGGDAYVHNSLAEEKKSSDSNSDSKTTITVIKGANVRSGPGTDKDVLGTANVGTEYTSTGKDGDWYKIDYNGKTGYIAAELVKES